MAVRPRTLGQKPKAQRRRDNDAVRRQAKPWRSWYSLPVWQAIRTEQLARQPLCERHLKRDEIVAATVVNHVRRHGGDWDRFVTGPFESLCKPCHDSDVQREERAEAVRSSSTLRP